MVQAWKCGDFSFSEAWYVLASSGVRVYISGGVKVKGILGVICGTSEKMGAVKFLFLTNCKGLRELAPVS